MRKLIENEITRAIMIALLGVDVFITLCLGSYLFVRYNIAHIEVHPFVTGLLIILGITLFSLILRSAGHYRGEENIEPNFFDRVPLEIYLSAGGAIILGLIFLLGYAIRMVYGFELIFFLLAGIYLCSVFMCMSVAVRCKNKTVLTNTLIYMFFACCIKGCANFLKGIRKLWFKFTDTIKYYISNLSYFKLLVASVVVMGVVDLYVFNIGRWKTDIFIFIELIKLAVILLMLTKWTVAYEKIRTGTQRIAQGDTDYKINTDKMPLAVARQAENLNSINAVVANAVEKQLKSEKLKTELITNVSHDIKTPLTSIINYIDLLKKEPLSTQSAQDYVDVLSRQSDRLKKLVEDLVEASKASTGNISVTLADVNLNLLIDQTAGEYSEKAENADLSLAVTVPEDDVFILSDGRLLWRVFDNLLGNACKYSQPGTRVYIDLARNEGRAVVTMRNISRTQLNISPDELMERFVRGDSSRNTEGSGLGLNIAQGLVEILGGEMTLHIDGDLFKVVVSFTELKI